MAFINMLIAFLLDLLGILLPLKSIHKLTKPSQFVLLFHNIADKREVNYFNSNLNFDPYKFKIFLRMLHKLEYQISPLEDLGKCDGNRVVYLTFDDGYPGWVNNALPILNDMRVPATFFVSTGFITGEATMWWSEIDTDRAPKIGIIRNLRYRKTRNRLSTAGNILELKSLLNTYGITDSNAQQRLTVAQMLEIDKNPLFDFALHSKHHLNLSNASKSDLDEEIHTNITDLTSMNISFKNYFAFPYGEVPKAEIIQAIRAKYGISLFFSTKARAVQYKSPAKVFPRVTISGRLRTTKGHFVLLCILSRMKQSQCDTHERHTKIPGKN